LHKHEKFKKTRAERIKAIEELIIVFREINEVSGQIKIDLPKIKLPEVRRPQEVVEDEPAPKPQVQETDELKKLEAAISQIENRLNDIN